MVNIPAEPVTLDVTCQHCLHFKEIKIYKDVCEALGVKTFSPTCRNFMLNWKDIDPGAYKRLQKMLERVSTENLPIVAALINNEIKTRKGKFSFGMPVYVRLFGDDFFSNYAKCWVIFKSGRYVYVKGTNNKFAGVFLRSSVLTEKKFIEKGTKLIKEGKLRDPKFSEYTQLKIKKFTLDNIPSIDSFVENRKSKANFGSFSITTNAGDMPPEESIVAEAPEDDSEEQDHFDVDPEEVE